MQDFIKIRSNSFNLFAIVKILDQKKVVNNYNKASDNYLKISKNEEKEPQEYKQILVEIKPYIMGHQLISTETAKLYLSQNVYKAIENLKYIFELNNISYGKTILLHKPTPLRIDIAFIYDYEISLIKDKLARFEGPNLEYYSNSDIFNKSKFEKLIKNYKSREIIRLEDI